ncbi:unnamed protein product [Rhodiola kirilowii]
MPPNAHTVPGYSQKSVSHFSSLSHNTMSNEKDVAVRKMFEEWMAEYGRAYSNPKEKETRFKIFKETVQSVNAHNKVEGRMYDQCVNNFADLTDEEFNNTYCGFGCGAKRGLSREG